MKKYTLLLLLSLTPYIECMLEEILLEEDENAAIYLLPEYQAIEEKVEYFNSNIQSERQKLEAIRIAERDAKRSTPNKKTIRSISALEASIQSLETQRNAELKKARVFVIEAIKKRNTRGSSAGAAASASGSGETADTTLEADRQQENAQLKAESEQEERLKAHQQEAERVAKQQEDVRLKEESERAAKQQKDARLKEEAERQQEDARLKAEREQAQERLKAHQQEAERVAKQQEDVRLKEESERAAKQQEDARLKEEAERAAKQQKDARLKEEAERVAKQQKDARLKEEAERVAKQQEDARLKEEAERVAKQQKDARLKEEAERVAKQQKDARLKEEAERVAKESANKKKQKSSFLKSPFKIAGGLAVVAIATKLIHKFLYADKQPTTFRNVNEILTAAEADELKPELEAIEKIGKTRGHNSGSNFGKEVVNFFQQSNVKGITEELEKATSFANMQMKEEWASIRSRTSHKRFIDALQNILRILNTTNLPQVTYRTVLTDDLDEVRGTLNKMYAHLETIDKACGIAHN